MNRVTEMLKLKTWAIVGATDNKSKFGYKIFQAMKKAGLSVYPVNPGVKEIDGQPCYASLGELPIIPEAVDMVVPPKVGEQIVRQCAQLGIRHIWFQPGADSKELMALSDSLHLNTVHNACIMVELRKEGAN